MLLIAGLAGLFLLPEPWNVIAVSAAAIVEVGEVFAWIRFLRRYRVRTGAEGMVGARGEVIASISNGPGKVRVHGEIWAARARESVERGEEVVVTAVDGLTLGVERPTEKGP